MCYLHVHTCKYCSNEYHCTKKNWVCPTINGDADREMCPNCRIKLEEKLEDFEGDIKDIELGELLKD